MTQQRLQQVKDLEGWQKLDEDDVSSTISEFQGGHMRHVSWSGDVGFVEILVWKGVEDINTYTYTKGLRIEDSEDVPDWANYIIELIYEGIRSEVKFAETEVGAWTKAKRLAKQQS